jgi:hypothetical protein
MTSVPKRAAGVPRHTCPHLSSECAGVPHPLRGAHHQHTVGAFRGPTQNQASVPDSLAAHS